MRSLCTSFFAVLFSLLAAAEVVPERCLLYVVEHIDAADAPAIDGKLIEPVWENRSRIDTLRNFLGSRVGDFASQRSEFTVLCDGRDLYIGATFHEVEMKKLKASPANQPFWNDCIEVYFDPGHDGTRSIQLVIDCIGQRMWEKHYDEGYGWWADKAWHMLADWEGRSACSASSWTVEIRLNCDSFGIDPSPGSVCGFNPCRFRLGAGDEFSAWAFAGSKRQKSIPAWGHLLFARPGEDVQGGEVSLADIACIYGSLEGRCIEVPTHSGFAIFTEQGIRQESFRERLEGSLAELERRLSDAFATMASATGPANGSDAFSNALETEMENARGLAKRAREADLSIGACDRFLAEFGKQGNQLETAIWNVRLVHLVALVQHGGGQP